MGETLQYNGLGQLRLRNNTLTGSSRPLYSDYDENGNRTRITHPDGYFFQYFFDGLNRLLDTGSSNSHLPTANNANDSFENNFSYNPAHQLVRMGQTNDRYNFREVANRTGVYQPNGLNQYSSIAGQSLAYDTKGNLTNDGAVIYAYDIENRIVAVSGTVNGSSVNANLSWDTNGRLFQLTINGASTQFLYDGDALIQVDEPLVQYGSGFGLADRRSLFADHQGSVIAHANNSGVVLNEKVRVQSRFVEHNGYVTRASEAVYGSDQGISR